MTKVTVCTREPQYSACFDEPPVVLGAMAGSTFRWNPRRLGFVLARYKFVAQMFKGFARVAEIGCADGFATTVVDQDVGALDLYDFDLQWVIEAEKNWPGRVRQLDIVEEAPPAQALGAYDGVFMLDVLEHIQPFKEARAMANIARMLKPGGAFIAGVPSLESQAYAAEISKAGHVNCRTGELFREDMRRYFDNAFLFGMNDEVVHVGFPRMCHYLFAVCTGPKALTPA